MDVNIKENVEKMLNAGKENGSIKTTTITQLLNDLGIYSEEQYNEIIELIEERNITLVVDSTEQHPARRVGKVNLLYSIFCHRYSFRYSAIDFPDQNRRKAVS